MTAIVFVTTAWGPRYGGVNAFNSDLACAVARSASNGVTVRCVVLNAARDQVEDAGGCGVRLMSLDDDREAFSPAHAYQLQFLARDWGDDVWWVGHDVVSGPIAVAAARLTGARSVVVQHTDYEAYGPLKGARGDRIVARAREEARTLLSADVVFGVGPKLARAAADRVRTADSPSLVAELLPGLAGIEPLSAPPSTFHAITFGRLDPTTDRVKQGTLAVVAFGTLIGQAGDLIGRDPRMTVIGVPAPVEEEQAELLRLAAEHATRAVPVICTPYTESRDDLFGRLRTASVCLMLSVHEGFGLTGWEAVAAEVPLVLSKNSGLYDLFAEKFGGPALGCLHVVDIEGWPDPPYYTPNDVAAVTRALRDVALDQTGAKRDAHLLKQLVVPECGWERTAEAFLAALQTGVPSEHGNASTTDRVSKLQLLPTTNVPAAADTFVGREDLLEEIPRLLLEAPGRLVTLVGPPGIGKTRLAEELARRLLTEFDHHVYFVDLSSVVDPDLVMASITRALRVEVGEPVLEALKELFGGTRAMLVLDNFEQVLPAAETLRELIGGAPGLHVVSTSQAPLDVVGELEVELQPLSADEAAELFAERSSSRVSARGDRTLNQLCERLDRLPLAIELVAVRARHYSPTDLLDILGDSVLDLSSTRRDVPARHRSLRAAVEWSHGLLTDLERRLFRRLAVFEGGWTLSSAAGVLGGGSPPSLQFADEMGSLLDKRLLGHDIRHRHRFTMLGALHEYAAEQLGRDSAEAQAVRGEHATYFLRFAEQTTLRLAGPEEEDGLRALEVEQDNVDAALAYLVDRQDAEGALRLAVAMGPFWWSRDYSQGYLRLRTVLDLPDVDALGPLRARALFELGRVGIRLAKLDEATAALQEARTLARIGGDELLQADVCGYTALVALEHGDPDTADGLLQEALILHRRHSVRRGQADDLDGLGVVAASRAEPERAERLLAESLDRYEALGDARGAAWVRSDLARVALLRDRPDLARERAAAALQVGRSRKDWGLMGWAQRSLGIAATMRGHLDEARDGLQESLSLFALLGNQRATVLVVEALAALGAAMGHHESATQLVAAADAHRERIRVPRTADEHALLEPWLRASREVIPAAQRDRAAAIGREMTIEQAVAVARGL